MNFEQLAFWLRGSVEARNFDNISLEDAKALLKSIQDHSALPFNKVTPDVVKVNKGDDALREFFEKNRTHIKPDGIKITPSTYLPLLPKYDYDRKDYWLTPADRDFKPGTLYC